jgi:hypothetical protein
VTTRPTAGARYVLVDVIALDAFTVSAVHDAANVPSCWPAGTARAMPRRDVMMRRRLDMGAHTRQGTHA